MTDHTRVLVTGASGFIAKHIVLGLVEKGFRVRGTVRSTHKAAEVRGVLREAGADEAAFEPCVADLSRDEGWDEAVRDCRFVLHTASPFPATQPKEKFGLVSLARGGTLRVVEAAKRAGVERIVLTSSVAAVGYGHGGRGLQRYDATTFSNVASPDISPYAVSKTEAERAAWDAVSGSATSLVSINPALVLGPLLDGTLGTSATLVSLMMRGRLPAMPDLGFGIVDVRDVAEAHIRAMGTPAADGQRFLLSAGNMRLLELAEVLRQVYPDRASRLPRFRIPTQLIRVAAMVSSQARMLWAEVGSEKIYDSGQAGRVLGLTFRPPEEAVLALAETLIRFDRA